MKTLIAFFIFIIPYSLHSQKFSDNIDKTFLLELIKSNKQLFEEYLANPQKFEVQIIYTQINRVADNLPTFKTFFHNVNADEYFYPASTVKLPAAILSLEKLNELNIHGLSMNSTIQIDSTEYWQTAAFYDSTSPTGLPSIANYIKKIFLISDNDAYNRLYEFLSQEYLNEELWKKGLTDCRLVSRLSVYLTPEQNACTNPIKFFNDNELIFFQPQICNQKKYPNKLTTIKKGIGYYLNDSLINEPKDFSNSNYVSLEVLHEMLKRLFFPEVFSKDEIFNLTDEDYYFIYKYMGMFPRESSFPKYSPALYPDNYVKFFMFWNSADSLYKNVRIFNKVGQAYGYLIDNAFVVDFKNNIEFLLSAVIYVNDDQIFNDDKYEYEEIGIPFLSNLCKIIYQHELKRQKRILSDLSKFNLNFNKTH